MESIESQTKGKGGIASVLKELANKNHDALLTPSAQRVVLEKLLFKAIIKHSDSGTTMHP